MAERVNRIHNPDFRVGRTIPSHWEWHATDPATRWERVSADADEGAKRKSMRIVQHQPAGMSVFRQVVVCRPGQFYRFDAEVRCSLRAPSPNGGLIVRVEELEQGCPTGLQRTTPALQRADDPTTIRAYLQVGPSIRRIRFSVGIEDAAGRADIALVRMIRVLEPDQMSHPLAVPRPAHFLKTPRVVASAAVWSKTATHRPVTRLLSQFLGEANVVALDAPESQPADIPCDAVFLPDAEPPAHVHSLYQLIELAAKKVVIISLPAFARLAGAPLKLRRVEQVDDPIHAKVVLANHVTGGFALHDVFPFAWPGRQPGSFRQDQFVQSESLKRFCKENHFVPLLTSMCDRDATSDQPICLYKETPGGGLYVLDIEPAEAAATTLDETNLAVHLLYSLLGHHPTSLGQYVSPLRKETEFRDMIREMADRFDPIVLQEPFTDPEAQQEQLITIGRDDETFGLPIKPKPVILLRSGLTSGDAESVFGTLVWIKQLVRSHPHPCPYATALATRFRFAWLPCVASWEPRDGWRRLSRPAVVETALDVDDPGVAALVDVVSLPVNRTRVVLADEGQFHDLCTAWLPRLLATFPPGRYFSHTVAAGDGFSDRSSYGWRHVKPDVEVVVDPDLFPEKIHRDLRSRGSHVVRLETPGSDFDFVAHSMERTDIVATLLERVIGLLYGLIAVNRTPAAAHLDGFTPLAPGDALIVDQHAAALHVPRATVGTTVLNA